MASRGSWARSTWSLAGFLLLLVAALGAQAEPTTRTLPGRPSDSREPWGAFLGRAAHDVIALEYKMAHPDNTVFLNTVQIQEIVTEGKVGDAARLPEYVKRLRPDITDTTAFVLFEIKPDNEEALKEGREQANRYLAALNLVVPPGKPFVGGTGLQGSLFLEFENGGAVWELSWRTPEPGVTLYRWRYHRKAPKASLKELAARKAEELPREEIEKYEELAEQVLQSAYGSRERPPGFKGQVYLPVDCQ